MNTLRPLILTGLVGLIGGFTTAIAGEPAAPLEFRIIAERDVDDANCIHTNTPDVPYLNIAFMRQSIAVDGPDDSPDARLVWRKIASPAEFLNVESPAALADAEAVQSRSPVVVAKHEGDWYVLLHDESGMKMVATPGKTSSWSVVSATAVPVNEAEGQFSVHAAVNEAGGKMLANLTKSNIGRSICVCVSGEAMSHAKIMSAVGDEFVITGHFDEARAKAIARTLLTNPAALAGPPAMKAE